MNPFFWRDADPNGITIKDEVHGQKNCTNFIDLDLQTKTTKRYLASSVFIRGVKLEFYIGGGLESPNDVINKQPPERHPQICTFSCTLYMALWLRHDWSRCFAYRVIRRQKRIGFVWPLLYDQDIANCNMFQLSCLWLYNYTHWNPVCNICWFDINLFNGFYFVSYFTLSMRWELHIK